MKKQIPEGRSVRSAVLNEVFSMKDIKNLLSKLKVKFVPGENDDYDNIIGDKSTIDKIMVLFDEKDISYSVSKADKKGNWMISLDK